MAEEHRYYLGKCNYQGKKSKVHEAYIEWSLKNGNFHMTATIWEQNKEKTIISGDVVDQVVTFFPENTKAQMMCEIWRRWNDNKLRAGSPAQMEWLREHPKSLNDYMAANGVDHYAAASKLLRAHGLNPDPNFTHYGKPYLYGSAWLEEELPIEIIEEIFSWSEES